MAFSSFLYCIFLFPIFFQAIGFLSNVEGQKMPICKPDVLTSTCSPQYCVDPTPTNRNWYGAMAECRAYGGELVLLEWPEKVQAIRDQLTGYEVNLSRGLFVNAHKQFYWANDQFAWKSGETIDITANQTFDECVYFSDKSSSYSLSAIQCDEKLVLISLICQRSTRRIHFGSLMESYRFPLSSNWKRTQLKYPHEQCEYFTFVRDVLNWYQAKTYCEIISSELMGVPNKEECQLIDQSQLLNPKPFNVFLNLHLYLYSRNFSAFLFNDNLGNSLDESQCNFNNAGKFTEVANQFCIQLEVSVAKQKTILTVGCKSREERLLKGFICKQCRPTNYTRANDDRECVVKDASVSSSSIKEQADSLTSLLLYFFFMFLCVLLFITLTMAYFFFMFHRRARTGNSLLGDGAGGGTIDLKVIPPPLPTSCPPDSPYDLVAGQPDTGEAKAPHIVAYGTGSGYRPDPTYAEPTDFDDAGLRSGGGNAPETPIAQPLLTRLVSQTSSNESYNKSGTL